VGKRQQSLLVVWPFNVLTRTYSAAPAHPFPPKTEAEYLSEDGGGPTRFSTTRSIARRGRSPSWTTRAEPCFRASTGESAFTWKTGMAHCWCRRLPLGGQIGKFVYVVGPDNKADQRYVSLGPTDGDLVVVMKGVHEGEHIIVGNLLKVGAGTLVQANPDEQQGPS
jgi:hypothetical protein